MAHRKKRLMDITAFEARSMEHDGNIDFGYWFNKSVEERLHAAAIMNAAAFGQENFIKGRIDKTNFQAKKRQYK